VLLLLEKQEKTIRAAKAAAQLQNNGTELQPLLACSLNLYGVLMPIKNRLLGSSASKKSRGHNNVTIKRQRIPDKRGICAEIGQCHVDRSITVTKSGQKTLINSEIPIASQRINLAVYYYMALKALLLQTDSGSKNLLFTTFSQILGLPYNIGTVSIETKKGQTQNIVFILRNNKNTTF